MTLTLRSPATDDVLHELPSDDTEAIITKVLDARSAQPAWAARPLSERCDAICGWLDRIMQNKDGLALQLSQEMGKPKNQALNEINALPARIQFFLDNVADVMRPDYVAEHEHITYEPLGVVANISAWNYPYFVGSNVFVPALLTGNAVVYKPSEITTLTGLSIAKHAYAAGIPKEVFPTIVGDGEAGSDLLECPIHAVFFTGSRDTGRLIAQQCAEKLIPVQLELGGKDPAYVCEDVDVETAVDALVDGAFYNAGQSCCAIERIYVHSKVYERFVKCFAAKAPLYVVGPLARREQLQVLADQVNDAVAKGARLLCGGRPLESAGNHFPVTVLADAHESMDLMSLESFGPIIGIASVDSDDEAVHRMNQSDYGLTAAVYTEDRDRAERLMQQLQAGTVYWNACDRVSPRLPWSGRKESGLGATLSRAGIRCFLQPKAWHL